MNPHIEIARTERLIEQMYFRQRAYLAGKSSEYLEELKHRAQELAGAGCGLAQVAAGLNQAACEVILEERISRGGGTTEKSCSTCNPAAAPIAPSPAAAGITP